MTVTGRTFSTSIRRMLEPVTDAASSLMTSDAPESFLSVGAGVDWARRVELANKASAQSKAPRAPVATRVMVDFMVSGAPQTGAAAWCLKNSSAVAEPRGNDASFPSTRRDGVATAVPRTIRFRLANKKAGHPPRHHQSIRRERSRVGPTRPPLATRRLADFLMAAPMTWRRNFFRPSTPSRRRASADRRRRSCRPSRLSRRPGTPRRRAFLAPLK